MAKVVDIQLNENVWNISVNDQVLYDAVMTARNNARQGSHSTLTRAQVSGGGRKPWKQKGTGNARAGSIRAPHWTGGGVVFGPTPNRNYTRKMNKKERRLALKTALTYKNVDAELILVDSLALENNKTKSCLNLLKELNINDTVLFVTSEYNENLILASRNLGNVCVLMANEINVLTLLTCKYVVIEKAAVEAIEEVLA